MLVWHWPLRHRFVIADRIQCPESAGKFTQACAGLSAGKFTRLAQARLQNDLENPFEGVLMNSRPGENQRVDTRGAIPAVGAVSGGKGLSGKRAR